MTTRVLKEFLNIQKDLQSRYGKKSVVLLAVGVFYEHYTWKLSGIGCAVELSKLLDLKLTRKNTKDKTLPEENNPYLIGIPIKSFAYYFQRIMDAGYVVAVYDERDIPNKKEKARVCVGTYSASTHIDDTNIILSSYIGCMKLEKFKCPFSGKMLNGVDLCMIDMITGSVKLYCIYDTSDETTTVSTELYRIFHTYPPKELLFHGKDNNENNRFLNDMNIEKGTCIRYITFKDVSKKTSYQEHILSDVYRDIASKENSIIDILNLAKSSSVIPCFIETIDYLKSLNSKLVSKLSKPTLNHNSPYLVLNHDSIYQLHIIPNNSSKNKFNLFNFLDRTKTPMGKRLLRQRLLQPKKSIREINRSYDFIESTFEGYKSIRKLLDGIGDLEKRYRSMINGKMEPRDFVVFHSSIIKAYQTLVHVKKIYKIDQIILRAINRFISDAGSLFDLEKMSRYDKTDINCESFFSLGRSKAIDEFDENVKGVYNTVEEWRCKLSKIMFPDDEASLSTVYSKSTGFSFKTTPKRFKLPDDLSITVCGNTISKVDVCIRQLKTVVEITFPVLFALHLEIKNYHNDLCENILKEYSDALSKFIEEYGLLIQYIIAQIADIDFYCCCAKSAFENGYVRPKLLSSTSSFFSATSLRHPIIEKNINHEYTPIDFLIDDNNAGHVIYGLNTCGKTSLIRAIGIAIVMAQAGMYVAAKSLELSPFANILSKISLSDNPSLNHSKLMVEIFDIRNMLSIANENTLIITDEMFSSTDTSSAIQLTSATLSNLLSRKSKFIFASHLHELTDVPILRDNPQMKFSHFEVYIDDEGKIVYDRKLSEGGISSSRGLDIAASLGMNDYPDFLRDAVNVKKYLDEGYDRKYNYGVKTSKYNSNVYMEKCNRCGRTNNLHTHHIIHQEDADERTNLIDNRFHKNATFNLEVICESCHQEEHANDK